MLDLAPAARTLTGLLANVDDGQLGGPTPCTETSVGGMLDHLEGVCIGFTAAALKDVVGGSQAPLADASKLRTDWRTAIPELLDMLVTAWRDEGAWSGDTRVGGVDLPGEAAGMFALDELLVHGWDLAVATGQPFDLEPADAHAVLPFLEQSASPEGTPGLFGPARPVPEGASLLERLLLLSGRDPGWRP